MNPTIMRSAGRVGAGVLEMISKTDGMQFIVSVGIKRRTRKFIFFIRVKAIAIVEPLGRNQRIQLAVFVPKGLEAIQKFAHRSILSVASTGAGLLDGSFFGHLGT
jgi:hypothetical protein